MEPRPPLAVDGVSVRYGCREALRDVSFEAGRGELVGLLGPNGSGKTTLLKCLHGILKPHKGAVFVDGRSLAGWTRNEIARRLAYVPQEAGGWFDAPTVWDVVLMGRRPHFGWRSGPGDEAKTRQALAGLAMEGFGRRRFDELSGGERQKILIARALAQEARILLLDEPTNHLDLRHQIEVMRLVRALIDERGLTGVVALHDLGLASLFCRRVILLKDGRIQAAGETRAVLTPSNIRAAFGIDVPPHVALGASAFLS